MGGGPAGSAAATIVADSGRSTLLVEREQVPRFHVGESLMPETYWTLRRLGVLERLKASSFQKKVGVQFVSSSGKQSQPFLFDEYDPRECSQTWHVRRADFDHILFENASKHGADCRDQTRVLDIRVNESGPHEVRLRLPDKTEVRVDARVIVDATGQQSLLANRLHLKEENPRLKKAAIWGHFRGAQRCDSSTTELTTILHGAEKRVWFWYIPLDGDVVSVGLVGDKDDLLRRKESPEAVFDAERRLCAGLEGRLANAKRDGELHIDKEFSFTTTKHAGDGWVLVGDAYGFIDPIYSTGVFLALKSGELAADAIVQGLENDDVSETQLGSWTKDFDVGVQLFRKLVGAFYVNEFSFAEFLRQYPQHQDNLTDLLIGRAFSENAAAIFEHLDPALAEVQQA